MKNYTKFTENQQYLTEPFDPEMSTSYKIDYEEFRDKIFNQIESIAKKYNLFFIRLPNSYEMLIENDRRQLKFKFVLIDDKIYLNVVDSNITTYTIYYEKDDIDSVEKAIKEYFRIR